MEVELTDHQKSPKEPWNNWILSGDRGIGKTFAMCNYIDKYARKCDGELITIIGPTIVDLLEGPYETIKRINNTVKLAVRDGNICILWPTDTAAYLLGTVDKEDVNRFKRKKFSICCREDMDEWLTFSKEMQSATESSGIKLITITKETAKSISRTRTDNKSLSQQLGLL